MNVYKILRRKENKSERNWEKQKTQGEKGKCYEDMNCTGEQF